ncbi:MAG: apolipoprotein N-acyltransferase, partial [Bacteroidota bacterium]
YQLLLLSILSGVLLYFSWPVAGRSILLFVGFIPLLFIEDHFYKAKKSLSGLNVFGYSYIAFFIFNITTTWWIYYASFFGAVMAIFFNSLFMSLVMDFFHLAKKRLGEWAGYLSLLFFWISFEYLHMDWDLSWPWLTLGNGFAMDYTWIQWYEYTGALAGSLWVLVVNILLFHFFKKMFATTFRVSYLWLVSGVLTVALPILFSLWMYHSYEEKGDAANVVVVQPNIDPYHEKFSGMTSNKQLDKLLHLANEKTDDKTDFLIGPETAIPQGIWELEVNETWSMDSIRKLTNKFPRLRVVLGLASYKLFNPGEPLSITARPHKENGEVVYYYDECNTAMYLCPGKSPQFYHKSKLVPGVEMMPFPRYLKFLESFALDLGGSVGSLGKQDERTVFDGGDKFKIAPVICYESIYGEYVGEYVRNGANLIFIITNDGWWGDTPGYRQHCAYGRLRAIEMRRSIARSANTGISCFINQRGDIISPTQWWQADVIRGKILANNEMTFYAKNGDYIAHAFLYVSALVLLMQIFYWARKKWFLKSLEK